MSTTTSGLDVASRLGWALRRYWPVLAAGLAAFVAVGLLVQPRGGAGTATYEARALIAAADLQIRPEQLARTASTIFRAGDVARGAAARLGLDVDPDDLVPEVFDVEPVEDTVLIGVLGRDADPIVAADLANAAAGTYLVELNALGEGFGSFVEVAPARPPADPLPQPSGGGALLLSAIAGLVFAAGAVGLLLSLRRPVIGAGEAAAVAGVPLIGAVALPRTGPLPPVAVVPGLSAMVRQVLPDRTGSAVFVSVRGGDALRSQTALLFARTLARTGRVAYVAHGDAPTPAEEPNLDVTRRIRDVAGREDVAVVVDGLTADGMDVPQFLPGSARVVLVVHDGAAEAAVRDASAQFLAGELAGVVFAGRAGRAGRAGATGEVPPA